MRRRLSPSTVVLLCCSLVALVFYIAVTSQGGGLGSVDVWSGLVYHGNKAQKYTGWSLSDAEFSDMEPRKARIVFYIMVAGWKELAGLDAVLRALYHVDHFYLLHMDAKANPKARNHVKRRISQILEEHGRGEKNIRLVEPAMPITWGGFTMTLNAVYGITQALHWTTKWDYFINLSASDLPLIATDEIADILGEHKGLKTSFIKGFLYQPSWEGYKFVDRREMYAEDRSLLRDREPEKVWPWAILDEDRNMLTRPVPNLFTVYKGEFWVMLHRSMAEYVHKSPDNQARMLLAYFSGMMVSDEEFFQTVACNPYFPSDTLRTLNDNLRFVNWWGGGASPAVMTPDRAVAAANSGAMFGRKFATNTAEGRDGVKWVEDYLKDDSRREARVARVKRRLATHMGPEGEPQGFCGLKPEIRPSELYFAVAGDEEKLPPGSDKAGDGAGGARARRRLTSREGQGDSRRAFERHRGELADTPAD